MRATCTGRVFHDLTITKMSETRRSHFVLCDPRTDYSEYRTRPATQLKNLSGYLIICFFILVKGKSFLGSHFFKFSLVKASSLVAPPYSGEGV
jgi:hypothetical protein